MDVPKLEVRACREIRAITFEQAVPAVPVEQEGKNLRMAALEVPVVE